MDFQRLFEQITLTGSNLPVLSENEKIEASAPGVGLYKDADKQPGYEDGIVYLTTKAVYWVSSTNAIKFNLDRIKDMNFQQGFLTQSPKIVLELAPIRLTVEHPWQCEICHSENTNTQKCVVCGVSKPKLAGKVCPQCTFANHEDMSRCEMCDASLAPLEELPSIIKLSFRKSGAAEMWNSLQQAKKQTSLKEASDKPIRTTAIGVAGIVRNIEQSQKQTSETIQTAFQDLEALMSKASEITTLVRSITSKISTSSESEDQTQVLFRKQMNDFGIIQPTLKTAAGSQYHKQLAHELSEFLTRVQSVNQTSIFLLSDVYCLYNRARGVSLVSPQDLYSAGTMLEPENLPFRMSVFPSGVVVLKSQQYHDEAVSQRIMDYIESMEYINASKLAKLDKCSVIVAKEHLLVQIN